MSESYSVVAKLKAVDDGFSKVFGDAQSTVGSFNNKASAAMAKVAGVVAVAAKAAGAAAAAFSVMGIGAAADAQAINAQFSQTFGDLEDEAQSSVDGLGKQFGMLPNRIKPAFTQMTAKFKGLGLSTEEAMGQAAKATTLAADASAFYDTSMESAQSSLNSFVNGNYEGKLLCPPVERFTGKHQSKSVKATLVMAA